MVKLVKPPPSTPRKLTPLMLDNSLPPKPVKCVISCLFHLAHKMVPIYFLFYFNRSINLDHLTNICVEIDVKSHI